MKRRTALGLCLIAAIGNVRVSVAQEPAKNAMVTFYMHGNRMTSGVPGTHTGLFYGQVFDGKSSLFSFREGFYVKNNLVISFALQSGAHTFFASYGKTPAHGGKLPLTLDAGQHYFIRAESESKGIGIVEFEKGRLDAVSCETAHTQTEGAKVLDMKRVASQVTANVIQTPLPVTCP
jgi:hypothetical protein